MRRRLFLLIYISLTVFTSLESIDIEDMDRDVYFSDFLNSMTSGEFYNKYRIPLVFFRQSERDSDYSEYIRAGGLTFVTLKQKEIEEEAYFKSKCIYPELAILREISNAYISKSHLRWENCSNLQKKSKQLEMSGQKNFIPELVKKEKEYWKKTVIDGLESIIPLPLPQILPGGMAPGVSQHARDYLEILLSITVSNAYLQSNLHLYTEDSAYPRISWANSEITDFNELFYGSNLSSLNIKNKLRMKEIVLKNSYLSSSLNRLLRNSILEVFPAKTQRVENKMILDEYKKSTSRMISRMNSFEEEGKLLQSILSCFESWPEWHIDNLRLAYYFGYYNEYGREYMFSRELKNSAELWSLVMAIDKKIYSSEMFRKRTKSLYSDCIQVKSKTPAWIQSVLEKEEALNKQNLLNR